MNRELEADLKERLRGLEAESLRRELRRLEGGQGAQVAWGGRVLHNFSSNDYLSLSREPFLVEAAKDAVERYGTGAGASRLVCGNLPPHEELEGLLAEWKGAEAALVYSSGYAAAVGTITALMGKEDVVILDKLAHASLIDGARLSGAVLRVFPHNHMQRLEGLLKWARQRSGSGRILVVTESVFSMDGDRSLLAELVELKERYGAWLMVDEAHGVGIFGGEGRGVLDELGLANRVEVQMGTLSKALGGSGGYVCGSRALREWLVNRARAFVYSTAMSPVMAAVGGAAVRWLRSEAGEERRGILRKRISEFSAMGFGEGGGVKSAIFPVVLGEAERALKASASLLEAGFLVPAIRYPTVARGSARLRVTLTAGHSESALQELGCALREWKPPGA